MNEEVLILSMKLLTLLTGEQFGDMVQCHRNPYCVNSSSYNAEPLSPSRSSEKQCDRNILTFLNKIAELLMEEVHIRCHDVTVHFTVAEWQYVEEHKDLYKDIKTERHRTSKAAAISNNGHNLDLDFLTAKDDIMEEIIHLTRRLILLISGKKYVLVKKLENHPKDANTLEGDIRNLGPITESLCSTPINENHQNILDITNKIMKLLTGEVPIRYQDISVYFSKEEWEYLERHGDIYKKDLNDGFLILHSGFLKTNCKQFQNPVSSKDERNTDHCDVNDNTIKHTHDLCKSPATGNKTDTNKTKQSVPQKKVNKADVDQLFRPGHIGKTLRCSPRNNSKHIYIATPREKIQRRNKTFVSRKATQERNIEETKCGMVKDGRYLNNGENKIITAYKDPSSAIKKNVKQSNQEPTRNTSKHRAFDCSENNFEMENDKSLQMSNDCFSTNPGDIEPNTGDKEQSKACSKCGGQREIGLLSEDGEAPAGRLFCRKCFEEQESAILGKTFFCSECCNSFSTKYALERHQMGHIDVGLYSCLECDKTFVSSLQMQNHLTVHTQPFQCSECGKRFSQNTNLKVHYRTHTGEKPYICSECGKSFGDQSNLNKHLKIHSGVKNISCSECGKQFYRHSHLVSHQLTHTGIKPFSCPECGKSFSSRSLLTKHEMIHSGKAPFQCSECPKKFCYSSDLYKHQKTHTGQKSFRCSECGKGFITNVYLTEHLRTHTGEKPFLCIECGKGFATRSNFRKHMARHKK
ncbi:uncharacterized protein [Pyxicephalus adspersus]|uniref:uncharacterized protein isoform X2 n=1 Tax=Pyxicephalus adspersus TaxID=30357 RepID=UPI003B593739